MMGHRKAHDLRRLDRIQQLVREASQQVLAYFAPFDRPGQRVCVDSRQAAFKLGPEALAKARHLAVVPVHRIVELLLRKRRENEVSEETNLYPS